MILSCTFKGIILQQMPILHVYVPLQVYPTMLRGFGMSLCSSASRLGAMASPFIPQVSKHHTVFFVIMVLNITPRVHNREESI